jgi:hypothetical protein
VSAVIGTMRLRVSVRVKRSWSGILLIFYFGWSLDRTRLVDCTTESFNLCNNNNNYVDIPFCVDDRWLIFKQRNETLCQTEEESNGTSRSK